MPTPVRSVLLGLPLVLTASTACADALQDCQNINLTPDVQRTACNTAIEATSDPEERAKLLVRRAWTWRREWNLEGIDNAAADLAEAERLAPDPDPQLKADMLVVSSELARVQDDPEGALADIAEAERLAPADADPLINRALVLFDQGNHEGAMAELAQAREIEPNNFWAHLETMFPLRNAGDLEGCVESGTKAVEIAPEEAQAWAARAVCLAQLGRADEALADLAEAERLGPYHVYAFDDMTQAYMALDRPEKAVATARRVAEIRATEEWAQTSLVNALVATGAVEEAIATFRNAKAAGVENPSGLANNLAWALYLAGEHEKALPIIEEGLAANPDPAVDESYAYQLGTSAHIRAALGRTDEAVQTFLQAAERGGPEIRGLYEERLTALGHVPAPGDNGFEAALRACVAMGEACRLFPE